jgi:hypothetical protein
VTFNAGYAYQRCTALSGVSEVCERGATASDTLDGSITSKVRFWPVLRRSLMMENVDIERTLCPICVQVTACSPDGSRYSFDTVGVRGCVAEGKLNTRMGGVYTLTFAVVNSAGLSSHVNRTITVISSCATGESLCLDGIECSDGGICAADLAAATPEAAAVAPPATTLVRPSSAFLSVP